MSQAVRLDASYAERAAPRGSARYLALLFAAPALKEPLRALFALEAEWQALADPGAERVAAELKLAWWAEEVRRLQARTAVHPICVHLASLAGAERADFSPLLETLLATQEQFGGVPLERGADLPAHASRLHASALRVAAQFGPGVLQGEALDAYALGEYLRQALAGYRRAARAGRVLFPVDELLAADVDNESLARDVPAAALADYLAAQRTLAEASYGRALAMLARSGGEAQRHVAVLAGLGRRELQGNALGGFKSLWQAWRLARGAGS